MTEWLTIQFHEIAANEKSAFSKPYGSAFTKNDYVSQGVPMVRGINLGHGIFHDDDFVFISKEKANEMPGANLRPGDLIFTHRGTIGQVSMIPRAPQYSRYVLSTSQVKARLDQSQALPEFYYYWFSSPGGQHELLSNASTVGVPGLRQPVATIKSLRVPLPPLAEQRAVAEVLGALDEKIAVNERIAQTAANLCRAMMQSLWKQGRVPSLTVDQSLDSHGWTRSTLGALCAAGGGSIQTGPFGSQLHASDYVDAGIPSVMPQNIGENIITEDGIARITEGDAQRLSKYLLREGDVVYSRRGDVKRRALVRRHESGWLCGTGCLRVRAGNAVEPLFLSHYLGEPEVQNWIHQHAVGATMPNLNTSILGAVPVVLPPNDVRARINKDFTALDARSIAAVGENKTLAALRDTLLPQLVTGKLRIKDAERAIEDAV
ncbi:restriction endonuclease subunit S [Streptomyces sp. NPDC004051]